MITREILEAQLKLYETGRAQALEGLEKVKADINAFNGAIEACNSLLNLLTSLEESKGKSEGVIEQEN